MQNKSNKYAAIVISNSLLSAAASLSLVYFIQYGAIGRLSAILIVAILFGFYSFKIQKIKIHIDYDIAKEAILFSWPLTVSAIL